MRGGLVQVCDQLQGFVSSADRRSVHGGLSMRIHGAVHSKSTTSSTLALTPIQTSCSQPKPNSRMSGSVHNHHATSKTHLPRVSNGKTAERALPDADVVPEPRIRSQGWRLGFLCKNTKISGYPGVGLPGAGLHPPEDYEIQSPSQTETNRE